MSPACVTWGGWTSPDSPGLYWTVLDCYGLYWAVLCRTGLCWAVNVRDGAEMGDGGDWQRIARVIGSQKMYVLFGLNHHLLEKMCDVTPVTEH